MEWASQQSRRKPPRVLSHGVPGALLISPTAGQAVMMTHAARQRGSFEAQWQGSHCSTQGGQVSAHATLLVQTL